MDSNYFQPISLQTNTSDNSKLPSSLELKSQIPLSDNFALQIEGSRNTIRSILAGDDDRILVIVGPCSLHDFYAPLEYADKLSSLSQELIDDIYFVMRGYIEKPRTTVGWKGLIYDPWLNGSNDSQAGLELARKLLREIVGMGLPIASELLQPISAGYFDDLISWGTIGARTAESQIHRELVSGLRFPVGFKNSTDGRASTARDAILAAAQAHTYFGVNDQGRTAIISTSGNPDTHLVLRGGSGGPNFDLASISDAKSIMKQSSLDCRFVVDCSHANSGKKYYLQPDVFSKTLDHRLGGEQSIKGMMIESYLNEGSQSPGDSLKYGISITDGCLGWKDTKSMLRSAALKLAKSRISSCRRITTCTR